MCKIGILCAGDQEAEPFFRLLQSPRISQKAMLSIHEGIIEKMEIGIMADSFQYFLYWFVFHCDGYSTFRSLCYTFIGHPPRK